MKGLLRAARILATAFLLAAAGLLGLRCVYAGLLRHRMLFPGPAPAWAFAAPAPGPRPLVLLLGDSRAAEWGSPSLSRGQIVNRGAFGATTSELLRIAPPCLDACRPDLVVIEAGINDLKLLGIRPRLRSPVVRECEANLAGLADLCHARGIPVLLLPVWPAGPLPPWRRLLWNRTIADAVAEVNARLAERDDVRPDLSPTTTPGLRLYRDALHLTPGAYAALTARLDAAAFPRDNERERP